MVPVTIQAHHQVRERKIAAVLTYLDYPSHNATSRRIARIVTALDRVGLKTLVICPIFRFPAPLPSAGTLRINLRFLRALGPARLDSKLLAAILFNLHAFGRVVLLRKDILVLQYESIYSFPAAFLARFFCGSRCIGDDVLIPRIVNRLMFIETCMIAASKLIVSPSSKVVRGRLSRTMTLRIPPGMTEKFVAIRKTMSFREAKPVFIGSLTYHANLRALDNITKMSALLSSQFKCQILIVGGPVPFGVCSNRRVKLVGELSDHSLLMLCRGANIGLLPFFGLPSEGPKVKLLDYMAANLLVISSPEGIEDFPGLVPWKHYVPASSCEDMAKLLTDIPSNPELYAKIAKSGHEFVMSHYRWSILLEPYLRALTAICQQAP